MRNDVSFFDNVVDATDQTITGRFAVFGKLSILPAELHNSKGPLNDFVDLTIDVDESL